MIHSLCFICLVLALVSAISGCAPPESADEPEVASAEVALPDEVEEPSLAEWKQARDHSLRQADGWLSLVGLYWLEEGLQGFGSDPHNDIVTRPSDPAKIGQLRRAGSLVEFQVEPGVEVLHEGELVEYMVLQADITGQTTVLTLGTTSFHLIERGEMVGIRVKDSASAALSAFAGMEYFDEAPEWRIEARFESLSPPKTIDIPNVLGTVSEETVHGLVVFELDGETYRLEPTGTPAEGLFLVFGDESNGTSTYGGGRFLKIAAPADGRVTVDFNRAYNPPCVFTPYATCPLPPPENVLPIAIPAGEKAFGSPSDVHGAGS